MIELTVTVLVGAFSCRSHPSLPRLWVHVQGVVQASSHSPRVACDSWREAGSIDSMCRATLRNGIGSPTEEVHEVVRAERRRLAASWA